MLGEDCAGAFFALDGRGHVAGGVVFRRADVRVVEVSFLAVFPDYAGRGVGSKLVAELKAHARVSGVDALVTHADEDAVSFWRDRCGFEATAVPADLAPWIHHYDASTFMAARL